MAVSNHQIAIIGGGIAGLAAAIALAQRGGRVDLFETAPEFGEIGAGLQISANALCVLDAMGIDLSAVASRPDRLELRDYRRGGVVASVRQNAVNRPRYYQLHRADLIERLATRAIGLNVQMHMGAAAAASHAPDMRPSVTAGQYQKQFDLVVAADGIKSTLRKPVAGDIQPRFTRQAAWRALVPMADLPVEMRHTDTHVYLGPNRHLVAYSLRASSIMNIVAVQEQTDWVDEGWAFPDTPAALQSAFDGWHGDVANLLAAVTSVNKWGLFDHAPLPRWSRDNIVLIGDAAHPMLPFMAQGAAMGIEDAWVLAAELDVNNIQSALYLYEKKRKYRTACVRRAAQKNGKVFHMANPVARFALHSGLRAVSTFAPKVLENRTNWIYGHDVTATSDI